MAEGQEFNPVKLIFWILSAIFVVMTSIGSFAATHLIAEVDSMHVVLNQLQTSFSATDSAAKVYRESIEYRLDRIEKKLDNQR